MIDLIPAVAGIIVLIAVFLLCREIVCWYFKINQIHNSMIDIENKLIDIYNVLAENQNPNNKVVKNSTVEPVEEKFTA